MFSHVMIGTNDIDRAEKFYTSLLSVLGIGAPMRNVAESGVTRLFFIGNGGMFGISEPLDGQPASHGNGSTLGFQCSSPEQVKEFHDAGVAAGGTSVEDPPGLRSGNLGPMHLCYLRDPDGNKLCGFHRPE